MDANQARQNVNLFRERQTGIDKIRLDEIYKGIEKASKVGGQTLANIEYDLSDSLVKTLTENGFRLERMGERGGGFSHYNIYW